MCSWTTRPCHKPAYTVTHLQISQITNHIEFKQANNSGKACLMFQKMHYKMHILSYMSPTDQLPLTPTFLSQPPPTHPSDLHQPVRALDLLAINAWEVWKAWLVFKALTCCVAVPGDSAAAAFDR